MSSLCEISRSDRQLFWLLVDLLLFRKAKLHCFESKLTPRPTVVQRVLHIFMPDPGLFYHDISLSIIFLMLRRTLHHYQYGRIPKFQHAIPRRGSSAKLQKLQKRQELVLCPIRCDGSRVFWSIYSEDSGHRSFAFVYGKRAIGKNC